MQIMIDIPEEEYKCVQITGCIGNKTCISNAIYNGTPIPKGHGKLIDADELLTSEKPNGIADDVWKESHIYKLLSNAPTIIEADVESEDKK